MAETEKELIVIKEKSALEAFNDDAALEKLFKDIKEAFEKGAPADLDMKVKKDRDTLRSFAAKIPKVKVRIDTFRKEATEGMRLQIAQINGRGSDIVSRLEAFHEEKRKPLTDYENAEKERKNLINNTIQAIRELGQISFGESSDKIQARIDDMPTHDLSFYEEFKDEAEIVINETFERLVSAKTQAQNAETDAALRAQERAELEELRAANEKAERERLAREEITNIKAAGNGVLYINNDFADTKTSRDWLLRLKIDSRFGDLVDDAAQAREEALERVQKKLDKEIAEEAAEKARLDEIKRQEDELAERQRQSAAEDEAKVQADRQRIEDAARNALLEEQAEQQRIADAEAAEAARIRKEELAAALVENRKQALEDIEDALSGAKRATAPQILLDAILAGKVRWVSADELKGEQE